MKLIFNFLIIFATALSFIPSSIAVFKSLAILVEPFWEVIVITDWLNSSIFQEIIITNKRTFFMLNSNKLLIKMMNL